MAIKNIDAIDFDSIEIAKKSGNRPQFTVIYGSGGMGKTTAACYSPNPVIIPIGRETGHERMVEQGIPAFENPGMSPIDFTFGCINKLLKSSHSRETAIFDNIGTFREAVDEDVAKDNPDTNLKAFGRGVGLAYPYYGKLLAGFDRLLKAGIHVILIAHDVQYNINLESGDYYSRTGINAQAGENTNVRALLEARAHNVLYMRGENPTKSVKGAGDRNKIVALSGDISRVIYTKPSGTFFAKSRANMDYFYEIENTASEEALLKDRSNPTLIKLFQDLYK